MVFFHPHKRGFQVRLGIAVPVFPHDLETVLIFHQTAPAFFQFFVELLEFWFFLAFPIYKCNPLPYRYLQQVLLEFQDLKGRTVVNFYDRIIRYLFMFCQLTSPVFFNHFPNLVHAFDHKHLCISKIILCSIAIFKQERVVFFIKGIYRIQQPDKVVIQRSAPDKRIAVRIGLYFCAVDVKLLKRKESLFL